MTRIMCVIEVDGNKYIDKTLRITNRGSNALVIYGRKEAKRMALILQRAGMKRVKVIPKSKIKECIVV